MIKVYTIGFTEKNAETFFNLLRKSGADHLIDIRLNNISQLAGFAKKDDLRFFLKEILGWAYSHKPELAPTKEILDAYKKQNENWSVYEKKFIALMERRAIETSITKDDISNAVLLCSEHKPEKCHRRLVVEYLNRKWNHELQIQHLF